MKWYDAPIVVIDFETTGFSEPSYIIEVGAVRYEGGTVVDKLDLRVRPGARIEESAQRVHGISNGEVEGEPPFEDVYPALLEFFEGAIPASYGEYDANMLHRELARMHANGVAVDEHVPAFSRDWGAWLDLLWFARKLHPGPRRKGKHTLATMTKKYGVPLEKAHNALADATAAGDLLWRWRQRMPDCSISELLRAIG